MTDLSIIIVTWNAKEVLLDCLNTIERQVLSRRDEAALDVETLVVDNGSHDGSVEAVRAQYPWAQVIALPDNIGFAAGNNVGLQKCSGRHAVLLNSDTLVLPDSLERCVRYLDANEAVGVVGPQLLNPDGSKQNCIHNFPSLVTETFPKSLLEMLLPQWFPSKRYSHAAPIEVDAVLGACLFVRREVFESVGLMPEDYFFFLEETDWCWRIKRAGWQIHHLPDSHIVHIHGFSTKKKVPANTRIEYHRSLYHFFRKNRGGFRAGVVMALRVAKGLFYVLTQAPAAMLSDSRREKWNVRKTVLAWHLRGRPASEGLASLRTAKEENRTS